MEFIQEKECGVFYRGGQTELSHLLSSYPVPSEMNVGLNPKMNLGLNEHPHAKNCVLEIRATNSVFFCLFVF